MKELKLSNQVTSYVVLFVVAHIYFNWIETSCWSWNWNADGKVNCKQHYLVKIWLLLYISWTQSFGWKIHDKKQWNMYVVTYLHVLLHSYIASMKFLMLKENYKWIATFTINWAIFVYENIHVLNVRNYCTCIGD